MKEGHQEGPQKVTEQEVGVSNTLDGWDWWWGRMTIVQTVPATLLLGEHLIESGKGEVGHGQIVGQETIVRANEFSFGRVK